MKKLLSLLLLLFFVSQSDAQILKRIADRTKQKTENKIAEKVSEKVSDAATKPIDEAGQKKNKKKDEAADPNNGGVMADDPAGPAKDNSQGGGSAKKSGGLSTYSKYDFVPGEKIIVSEDFSQDAIGDFPAKWNTNGSGEVVKVEGEPGHWLMINKKGRYIPEYINNLPENFTLEFDLMCNDKFSFYSNALDIFFLTHSNNQRVFEYSYISYDKRSGVKIGIHPSDASLKGGMAYSTTYQDGVEAMRNEVKTSQFSSNMGKSKVKVSIWRQKQRIRVYLNQEKVFDLPRAFAAGKTYNTLLFDIWSGMHNENDKYLISNIRLAAGAPDTRNKLITEGKFVTRGILFDVNSDRIKPESYGVLKDIANVLSENSAVKVKIVGHTDSDGSDADNMTLSKKRAAAVKQALSNEFNIDASRMETDGKGESQPADKNDAAEGKANNRRVEFIKI